MARVKAKPGELKIGFGRDGDEDGPDIVFAWGEGLTKADASLLWYHFSNERADYTGKPVPSLLNELKDRGFDLSTLKLTVRKK